MDKEKKTTKKDTYVEAVGRRKTSTARVRITPASKQSFIVNDKDSKEYFKTEDQRRLIQDPIVKGATGSKWEIVVRVSG